MKKLFVMAMAALLAVACAQEQKQVSAMERANEFNERVITTLAIIDIEEIGKAGGPDKWYASLDQEQQLKVVEACKEFTAIQAERAQWLRELNPEDQAIVREEIKKMGMDNEMRKINIMQRLMMLSKSNSVR